MRSARAGEGVEGGRRGKRGGASRGWTQGEVDLLTQLVEARTPTKEIARRLGRTENAIRVRASRLDLPLTAHEVKLGATRHARRQRAAGDGESTSHANGGVDAAPAIPRIKVTVDFDLSTLTRTERRELAQRLQAIAASEGTDPLPAPPPKGARRFVKEKSVLTPPPRGSENSFLNPMTRGTGELEVKLTRTASGRVVWPGSPERHSKRWRRMQRLLERQQLEQLIYDTAMREIRANLVHEIRQILWQRREAFLVDVAEDFAVSIAKEVAQRDREYREFRRGIMVQWEQQGDTSPDERTPLHDVIDGEEKRMREWEASVRARAAAQIAEVMEWYESEPPFKETGEDALARYRRFVNESNERRDRERARDLDAAP